MKEKIFFKIIFLLFLIILIRLSYLVFFCQEFYQDMLFNKTTKYITISDAPRGKIKDSNGNILVDNKSVKTITYTKLKTIKANEELEIVKILNKIIKDLKEPSNLELKKYWLVTNFSVDLITEEENQMYEERKLNNNDIYELKLSRITSKMLSSIDKGEAKIYSLMNTGYNYDTKIIKDKNVTDEEYAKINELNIPGVKGSISWERVYLYGDLLRNIYGSVSKREVGIPKDLIHYYPNLNNNERVGISGLELQYDYLLRGKESKYLVNKDNTLTLVTEGTSGQDLVLNIDVNILKGIDTILKEELIKTKKEKNTEYFDHTYVIVSNPNTGGIVSINALKIVNNSFIDISNNIVNSAYTLGSVIKGASISVNYLNNLIPSNQKILDSCIKLYLVPTKCSHRPLGYIDDVKALAYSSNYYQYLTAIKYTGNEYKFNMKLNTSIDDFNYYREVFNSYGLGIKTGIDLPNEKIGIIGSKINSDLLLNLAIGQYDTYTPIELTQYVNTIASGKRISPRIVKASEPIILNEIILSTANYIRLKEGFKSVFSYGTAKNYVKVISAGGKTGTSETFYDKDFDGKIDTETTSTSAVFYAPEDNPKYSITIVSPHVSSDESYVSNLNRRLSDKITRFLFEN